MTTMQERANATEIAVILPQLVAGMQTQRDLLASVEKNQERTTTVLEGIVETQRSMRDSFEHLEGRVNSREKTQWPVLISAAGFILAGVIAIGSVISSGLNSKINHLMMADQRLTSSVVPRAEQTIRDAHVDYVFSNLSQRTKQIDNRLREVEKRTGILFKEGNPY